MRLLIIEDEKDIINFLKPALEDECFVVDTARDGEKGSYLARSNNYDLIILDNVLPKKSGKEICQELRRMRNNIPILMLSVLAETDKKSEILTIDNLTLNSKKHEATKGQKEIYLTKKEFMLLEYLMRNQGYVISRNMLLEHIWDMNADPFSNTVETHITSLRKKIDDYGEKRLIYTISGRGYKITDKNIK